MESRASPPGRGAVRRARRVVDCGAERKFTVFDLGNSTCIGFGSSS
jgi:hypothetical protein